jgi:hypothetical protein
MTRTVIRIEGLVNANADTQVQLRPEEPTNVKNFGSPRLLACRADTSPFADLAKVLPGAMGALPGALVRKVGEELFQALSVHDGVLEALDRASQAAVNTIHPIYVASDVMDAEALPFEVLYHPNAEFLGLDPRWPIARMVGRQKGSITRFLRLPLRMAAVLSAADRDAIPEWEALRSTVVTSKLPVALTVYAGRDDLAAHITAQADPWVTLERVPLTSEELMTALVQLRPQFVHVFSHGSAQFQGSYLEIATRNTFTFGDAPIYLTAKDLARLRDLAWLITLNACEGAAPAAQLHSMAYAVVENGVPATIGMREEIDSIDASHFCRAFYTAALGALAGAATPGARVQPDWCEPLRLARTALCARNPGPIPLVASSSKTWTLPVLYRRAEDFVVQVALSGLAISDDEQERIFSDIDTMQQLRDGMTAGAPAGVLVAVDAEIAKARARLV